MLSTLHILVLVGSPVFGVITDDLSCTTYLKKYSSSATACSNFLTDASCQILYPETAPGAGYPGFQNEVRRPFMCTGDTEPKPSFKLTAIANCAKTCGFCCLTPAFNCTNTAAPRVDCNTVTPAMCQSDVWRQVLTEDCPATCGLCPPPPAVGDPCVPGPDTVSNCQAWALNGFCTSTIYTLAQKRNYCAKTCRLC